MTAEASRAVPVATEGGIPARRGWRKKEDVAEQGRFHHSDLVGSSRIFSVNEGARLRTQNGFVWQKTCFGPATMGRRPGGGAVLRMDKND